MTCPEPDAPTVVLRRLPGEVRSRGEALRQYQDRNAERRKGIEPTLWWLCAPDAEDLYRWRVQLDCDCIKEVLTRGDKNLPAKGQWLDLANQARLPEGQIICLHEDSPPPPYQDIVEWGERRAVTFPADPVEPKRRIDPKTWAVIRHDTPHTSAFWRVTLSCGHVTEVVADLDWKPADGPRCVSAERQQEMIAEFEECWKTNPDRMVERERQHIKRLLAEGWPSPQPERLCYRCPSARFIIAYEPIGWLVPRKPKPKPKPKQLPSRASLKRRLRAAEAEVNKLREQLAQIDEQNDQAEVADT